MTYHDSLVRNQGGHGHTALVAIIGLIQGIQQQQDRRTPWPTLLVQLLEGGQQVPAHSRRGSSGGVMGPQGTGAPKGSAAPHLSNVLLLLLMVMITQMMMTMMMMMSLTWVHPSGSLGQVGYRQATGVSSASPLKRVLHGQLPRIPVLRHHWQ